MNNLSMFCLTLNPEHGSLIKQLSYIPVGLGTKKFPEYFLNDKKGNNISKKFILWRIYLSLLDLENYLDKIKTEWVGFCHTENFLLKKI